MSSHDSLADIWQYLVAGASSAAIFVGSHIKVRDRVKTLEVKTDFIESKGALLDDTHTTVVRLEERMSGLESDMRASAKSLEKDLRSSSESQQRVERQLATIGRMFKLDDE